MSHRISRRMPHHVAQFRSPMRPWWMRVLNGAGRLIPGLPKPDAEGWWRAARAAEGGEPTPEAALALAALVDSLDRDAALNPLGRFSAKTDTVRMARTHLRVERALREAPATRQTKLPPMIFIIGWPRTGTTALHTLLGADPRNRTIPYWESFDPVPPEPGVADRRAEKVDRMLAQLTHFAPDYHAIHPMSAHAPEECVALFMNYFRTLQFDIQYRATGYVEWLLAQDARIAYRAYLRQLELICHGRPEGERLVLKDPTHLVHLETILELFPEAKIVYTHRDPAAAISSICSLYAHTRSIFSDAVESNAIGREILAGYWPRALDGALALRDRIPSGSVADLRHEDLVRDPIGTVEKLYEDLALGFDDRVRRALAGFLAQRAREPRSVHEHSPAGFGLHAREIDERFDAYRARFDLGARSA